MKSNCIVFCISTLDERTGYLSAYGHNGISAQNLYDTRVSRAIGLDWGKKKRFWLLVRKELFYLYLRYFQIKWGQVIANIVHIC